MTGLEEQRKRGALIRHGYDPEALASGTGSRKPGDTRTWRGAGGVLLRYRVCELDGIVIDGHEGDDLDAASTACIHCGYEGPHP